MSATTLTRPAPQDAAGTWRRPAPFLSAARRWRAWRIAWAWTHGGLETQVATYNRWYRWRLDNE